MRPVLSPPATLVLDVDIGEAFVQKPRAMHEFATYFGTVFAAFFAIMNPIANTPIFLGLTEGLDKATTRSIAVRGIILTFFIVAVFTLSGSFLFKLFGITLPAFRIAGGLLVALVGAHLLQGQHSSVHTTSKEDAAQSREASLGMAVSPLAMPLLAGPGTLVTGMNYAAGQPLWRVGAVIGTFAVICAVTLICFLSGQTMVRFLGKSFVMVISRLMGLILAVIGTQMVIAGVLGVANGKAG